MKTQNLFVLMGLTLILFFVSSCKKNDSSVDLTSGLTGTYEGNLEISGQKSNVPATTFIEKVNDYSVSIHCNSDVFDTTFIMDLYENGDSMMVCFTDADFQNEYHHEMMGGHNMMNDNNWMMWSNHMNNNHTAGDVHYGGFSMTNHTFTYRFKTPGSDSQIS